MPKTPPFLDALRRIRDALRRINMKGVDGSNAPVVTGGIGL